MIGKIIAGPKRPAPREAAAIEAVSALESTDDLDVDYPFFWSHFGAWIETSNRKAYLLQYGLTSTLVRIQVTSPQLKLSASGRPIDY
jgi:hypothetical protein